MAIASIGPGFNRRRVDRDKVRSLCELMLASPGATVQEYADQLGVTRRTVERWRRYEAFQIELHALSQERFNNVLLPRALRAAEKMLEKMLDGVGGQPATNLVIEILRAQGMLGIRRMDVHHSGVVGTVDLTAVRERITARLDQLAAEAPVAPPNVKPVAPLRRFNGAIDIDVIDGKTIHADGDSESVT